MMLTSPHPRRGPAPQILVPFVLLPLTLASCVPDDEPPTEEEPAPFDPSLYELIEYDLDIKDGEAWRGENDTERVFHVQRFRLNSPLTIHAVGAMFNVRGDDSLPAHLAVYGDRGHNFFDFDRAEPMLSLDLPLNKSEHDEVWQILELDEPIDIPHPQLVYVGSEYRGEPGQPVLATDDEVSVDPYLEAHAGPNEQYPPHVAVLPDRGVDANGFETVLFAGASGAMSGSGDLMVRLYVERRDVVAEDETWFRDETDSIDEAEEGTGTGLFGSGSPSFGDCDSDGDEDVWDGKLHQNQGDGTFIDITDDSGIDASGAAAWGDFNNDGHLDLFLAAGEDQLFEGLGNCQFTNVTAASGINDTQPFNTGEGAVDQHVPTPSAAWLDIDGDGLLDLAQANFLDFGTGDASIDRLWLNQGDGSFIDATETAGMLQDQGSGKAGRGLSPADWDNDGDSDLFVSNYRLHRNFAWQNDGSGQVTNVAAASPLGGVGTEVSPLQSYYGHTIGSAWADVDGDGDQDLFCANLAHPRFLHFSNKSMFLQNQLVETGALDFVDVAEEAGILYQETDSSPVFLDFDNDGQIDLFYTAVYPGRPSYLYRNEGDWRFSMVSYQAGTWIYGGWGVSAADLDNDGDLDLYGGRFFRNEHHALGGWLKVQVVGSGEGATNRSGIGARLLIDTGDGIQSRQVFSSLGVSSGASLIQHFGLGSAEGGALEVYFPGTESTVTTTFTRNQSLVVYEDGTLDLN